MISRARIGETIPLVVHFLIWNILCTLPLCKQHVER